MWQGNSWYIFILNESRIASGPVNGAHFPCPISWDWTRVLILSLIIASLKISLLYCLSAHSHVTFTQIIIIPTNILSKSWRTPKNATRNAEIHVQVSCHSVMRVTNYVTTLNYSSQDFKGEYLRSLRRNFLYCLIATLWLYDVL